MPMGIGRVEFNSHRVFTPSSILNCLQEEGLIIEELSYFRPGTGIVSIASDSASAFWGWVSKQAYVLIILILTKK